LRAALDASSSQNAETTSRIELRFNGSIAVAPTTLVGRNIEIRAGEGFRPSLNFQVSNSTSDETKERFLRLTSSDAVIDGVFVSFVVPKGVVGSKFSIFETSDASNLTIRNSILTFNVAPDESAPSALESSASFFSLTDLKDAKVEQSATVADDPEKGSIATVRLENVFVRGEASLANIARTGARIEAENCLFNLSGSFFRYAASQYDSPEKSSFSLSCNHILATCGSYFVQIDAENGKEFLPLFDVSVANSIVHMRTRPFAFVSSSSPLPEETFWGVWNFKGTTLLDATTFCRCNSTRDGSIKDYPSPFEKSVCETISLNEEARAANKRWEGGATSLLVPSEFVPSILTPLEESIDILPTTRENAKTTNELVESLIARFPDELTKD